MKERLEPGPRPDSSASTNALVSDSSTVWKNLKQAADDCCPGGNPDFGIAWSPFTSVQSAVENMCAATRLTNGDLKVQAGKFMQSSVHLSKAKQYYLSLSRVPETEDNSEKALGKFLHRFAIQLEIVSGTWAIELLRFDIF